ncbi:MAG: hypothetical protein ACO3D9_07150 [Ilumatobacteraceae bacterium]
MRRTTTFPSTKYTVPTTVERTVTSCGDSALLMNVADTVKEGVTSLVDVATDVVVDDVEETTGVLRQTFAPRILS